MTLGYVFFFLQIAILTYFVAINSVYFVFTIISFLDLLRFDRRSRRRGIGDIVSGTTFKPISILIPAHNEQETIVSNVYSILEVGYPEFEAIVINDGSTDETMPKLQEAFSLFPVTDATRQQLPTREVYGIYRSLDFPNLTVIDKDRGGKSDALNAGINASTFPLFCSIDADSLLNSDALLRIAKPFVEDDRIVAAGGIVRVLNGSIVEKHRVVSSRAPNSFLLLCQAIEYVRGFLTGRTALARLNALLIISGAFGLFQKKAVLDAGGYDTTTVCEDMELAVRLHRVAREEGRVAKQIFVPDPVCWTQVPEDWRSLLRQRDRWQRGLIETLWMHRKMFLNPKYGPVGMIAMPFYVIFEAIGPVIELFGYLLIPILLISGRFDPTFALLFFALAILYNIMLSLLALIVDDLLFLRYERARDLGKMTLSAFLEFIGYRQILAVRRTMAFFTGIFRRRHWGQIRRVSMSSPSTAKTP
jgi:cellulose synthase/poly-beta-1,6-N-acetylglucosamine synthase-like glycosyltransferase